VQDVATSPARFAVEFNQTVPGAYRKISVQDVKLLTECGLIGRYKYYAESDILTVIGILQYERFREKRIEKEEKAPGKMRSCKSCGTQLPTQEETKKGRRKEYCSKCEPLRSKLRNRKWRMKKLSLSF
jgi:hypothetical protein